MCSVCWVEVRLQVAPPRPAQHNGRTGPLPLITLFTFWAGGGLAAAPWRRQQQLAPVVLRLNRWISYLLAAPGSHSSVDITRHRDTRCNTAQVLKLSIHLVVFFHWISPWLTLFMFMQAWDSLFTWTKLCCCGWLIDPSDFTDRYHATLPHHSSLLGSVPATQAQPTHSSNKWIKCISLHI